MFRDATLASLNSFFGNRMVVLHPSRSNWISTSSAEDFWDERIEEIPTWIKAAKDTILAADAFYMVFSFFIKEVSLSVRCHKIRCILFAESKQGTRLYKVLECPK